MREEAKSRIGFHPIALCTSPGVRGRLEEWLKKP